MPRRCCVVGCKGNYDGESYTTVYSFPKDPDRRTTWLNAIHRENYQPGNFAVVCIKHFSEEFIVRVDIATRDDGSLLVLPRHIPKLTDDACPTIFPNLTSSCLSGDYSQIKRKTTPKRRVITSTKKRNRKARKLDSRRPKDPRPETCAVETPEDLQPAHPLPTANISQLAIQPTRLRESKKKRAIPRYEDITQIIAKVKRHVEPKCRLCMGESRMPMIPIFKGLIIKGPLATKIFFVTGISVVEGDGLPDVICQPCNKNIVKWYDFKNMCIASDTKYRNKPAPKRKEPKEKKGKKEKTDKALKPVVRSGESSCSEAEQPADVKLEIEEHNVFESPGDHFLDASTYERRDRGEEETLPAFVSIKVEPTDESMWNPEVSLSCVDALQRPDVECKMEFPSGVDEADAHLTDPLSIPALEPETIPPPLPPPVLAVRNPPPYKPRSYLIAMKPVSAPNNTPPTYVLAINNPAGDVNVSNVNNLPVITNIPVSVNPRSRPVGVTPSEPPTKRDGDPLVENSSSKKSKSGLDID